MPQIKLAPSILSADFSKINEEIKDVKSYARLIHVDIMDGVFVPQKTFDAGFVKKIKTKIPLDVHLMVQNPSEQYIKNFISAGAASITVHQEACQNLKKTILYIKAQKINACVALRPPTPLSTIFPVLDILDMVLIMTVEPGMAGQKFISEPLAKVRELRRLEPNLDIEVDGGINPQTIRPCFDAGANVFVAGSAIFKQKNRAAAIAELLAVIKYQQ